MWESPETLGCKIDEKKWIRHAFCDQMLCLRAWVSFWAASMVLPRCLPRFCLRPRFSSYFCSFRYSSRVSLGCQILKPSFSTVGIWMSLSMGASSNLQTNWGQWLLKISTPYSNFGAWGCFCQTTLKANLRLSISGKSGCSTGHSDIESGT